MTEKENYNTRVRYYNNGSPQKQTKYITIELPDDSGFNIDDCVSVSLEKTEEPFTVTVSTSKRITVGSILRQMNISDVITLDISKWDTVRSVASQLKREYGTVFSVRKDKRDSNNIIVTRLN